MRISVKQLEKCFVKTVSGISLGRIYDIICDTDHQMIVQYIAKTSRLRGKTYSISHDQVVRFEKNTLIVNDAVLKETDIHTKGVEGITPEPIMMRREDAEV